MGLSDSPLCRKCGAEVETSVPIVCECEALTSLSHAYLGCIFLSQRTLRLLVLGPSGNLVKQQDPLKSKRALKARQLRSMCIGTVRSRTIS